VSRETYRLKTPVALGEGMAPVEVLSFRTAVVAGDLRGIKLSGLQDMSTDDLLKLAGRLCAQPDAVMNKLTLPDLGGVIELIAPFLAGGEETGSKPSPS
jgi:hypothetical protein